MRRRADADPRPVESAAGAAAALAGIVLVGIGLWARRDVRRTLARERVELAGGSGRPVATASAARSMAELVRESTVAATGGRTYAETEAYVDAEGRPTADESLAARDERTGGPLENPDHDLWIQATALQTALMQAYMAFRLAELTAAIGATFVAVGAGLAAAGRRAR